MLVLHVEAHKTIKFLIGKNLYLDLPIEKLGLYWCFMLKLKNHIIVDQEKWIPNLEVLLCKLGIMLVLLRLKWLYSYLAELKRTCNFEVLLCKLGIMLVLLKLKWLYRKFIYCWSSKEHILLVDECDQDYKYSF